MRLIVAMLTLMLAAPIATAHTTAGAEYEHMVWLDGTFNQTALQDGYDLHDLWMWEAYDAELGEGVMLRFHVHGGNVTGVYDTFGIHAALQVHNETHRFSWRTQDDETWQGDLPITLLASNHTAGPVPDVPEDPGLPPAPDIPLPGDPELPDEDVPESPLPDVGGSWMHEMLVFVPLADINATVGDTVTGWTWRTTAERDRLTEGRAEADVDVAPGGFWLTGSPQELPEERPTVPEGEPGLPEAGDPISVFLQGPGRHLEAEGEWDDGQAVIRISNPYNETIQIATVEAPAGASAVSESTQDIEPGKQATFLYSVPLTASPQLMVWDVVTDIGGHARLEVTLPAAPAPPAPEETPAPTPPRPMERTDPIAEPPSPSGPDDPPIVRGNDSPAGLWVAVAAFALVLVRRRQ